VFLSHHIATLFVLLPLRRTTNSDIMADKGKGKEKGGKKDAKPEKEKKRR